MIGQKLRPVSGKMWQFHLNMNIEGKFDVTLWRNWWHHHYENHFGGWFTYYPSIPVVKFRLYWKLRNFQKFSKLTKIWGRANFFVISVTGNELCYLDSQSNFLRFELLIDVVAQKLMELWHFQNLTYFLTSWPSYLTYILVQRTCRNHGLVLACNEVWWWLTEPFLRFCEISVQTNKHTNRQTWPTNILAKIKFWQVMKGQSEIAYLPKFANRTLIVMVIVTTEIL